MLSSVRVLCKEQRGFFLSTKRNAIPFYSPQTFLARLRYAKVCLFHITLFILEDLGAPHTLTIRRNGAHNVDRPFVRCYTRGSSD